MDIEKLFTARPKSLFPTQWLADASSCFFSRPFPLPEGKPATSDRPLAWFAGGSLLATGRIICSQRPFGLSAIERATLPPILPSKLGLRPVDPTELGPTRPHQDFISKSITRNKLARNAECPFYLLVRVPGPLALAAKTDTARDSF